MWVFFELAKSILGSIVSSRLGQLALVAAVAWFWATHDANTKWRSVIAAEKAAAEAAYRAEIARQEQAARDIARDATARAEEDAQAASEMQKIIADYEASAGEKPNDTTKIVNSPCVVDPDFARVVRQLDALGRKTKAAGSTVKFR